MDLLSLPLTLRPLPPPDPTAPLPLWWGRAAHRLLLKIVEQYDPALASGLHDDDGPRPFTVSNLIGRFPKQTLDMEGMYTLRFTALQANLAAILRQAAQDGPLAPGAAIELDYHPFQVIEPQLAISDQQSATGEQQSKINHHPSKILTSYADLSAPYLLGQRPAPRHLRLELASPTAFKSGGKHVPLPLPDLVFGSLLERWNAFAPIAFPPETRRYAAECLAITRYDLHTHSLPWKSGGLRVGAVGEIRYVTLNYDRYWMSVLATLGELAFYAGVGVSTGMGLGQCRILDFGS